MNIINVNEANIDSQNICCAIGEGKQNAYVQSKKDWMKRCFQDGLTFKKLDARGKVFIEYIPSENAWYPIQADNYMHINCFWVSGQYKGKGYANELLNQCIQDALKLGKNGITIISSEKKRTFLSDPDYMKYKGFQVADTALPYFVLYYLPFHENAPVPMFKEGAKQGKIEEKGMVLYYTNGCPFTEKYTPVLQDVAKRYGKEITLHRIETRIQAQLAPTAFTTYSFFYNGEFITNEIFSEKKFEKFIQEHVL